MTHRKSTAANYFTATGVQVLMNSSRIAGLSALLLGAFFILGVGFAGADVIHNAVHDGRHSMAFPCH